MKLFPPERMMNRRNYAGLIGSAIVMCVAFVNAGTWTLDKLIDEGLANSQVVKAVSEEQKKADAQVKEAKGSAAPTVTMNAAGSYILDSYSPPFPDPYKSMSDLTKPKTNTLSAGINLNQPLYAQGKVAIGLRVAKLYNRQLLCKSESAKMQVKASVTKAFYQLLLAKQNAKVSEDALALAKETHKQTVLQFSVGKSAELDTLTSFYGVEKAEADVRSSAKGTTLAVAQLINVTGIDEPTATVDVSGEFMNPSFTISLEDALKKVHKDNKDLNQLMSGARIQEEQVKLARSDYLPRINATFGYTEINQFNNTNDLAGKDNAWGANSSVGVNLTWTLFNGLGTQMRVREAEAAKRGFEHTSASTDDALDLAARSAWESMESNRVDIERAALMVTVAQKAADISAKAYEVGRMTLLEMQNKSHDLDYAKMAYNNALFQFTSAVIDLRVLMGDYLAEDVASVK